MMQSQDYLESIFKAEWRKVMGTTVGDGYHLLKFLRSSARRLKAHFDIAGWPETDKDIIPYIHRTIERYG